MTDLQKFCSPYKPEIQIPFVVGAYSYATDGSILVRTRKRFDDKENPKAPDVLALPWWDHDSDKHTWIDPPLSFKKIQEEIENLGPKCGECGEWVDQECPWCYGTGKNLFLDEFLKFLWYKSGIYLNLKYLYLISRELKNVKFSTFIEDDKSPFRFRFKGGVGLLMPMQE